MEKNRHLITITEGGGGSTVKPLGAENPAKGGGFKLEKPPRGYGYFLEPQCNDGSIILI